MLTGWDDLDFVGMHCFGGADGFARSSSAVGSALLFAEDAGRVGKGGDDQVGREGRELYSFGFRVGGATMPTLRGGSGVRMGVAGAGATGAGGVT